MRPIETEAATHRYIGGPGIDDLHVEVFPEIDTEAGGFRRVMRSRWRPDETERTALLLGGDLVLDVMGSELAPVRLLVSAPPVDPERVFAQVDGVIATAQAVTIASLLAEIDPKLGVDIATVRAWSDDDRRAVSDWIRAWGETAAGGTLPAGPEVLYPKADEPEIKS
jgi:hypothetical protein